MHCLFGMFLCFISGSLMTIIRYCLTWTYTLFYPCLCGFKSVKKSYFMLTLSCTIHLLPHIIVCSVNSKGKHFCINLCNLRWMATRFMRKLSQQVIWNQALITNIWQMKWNWPTPGWQLYISAARLGLWAPASSLVDSPTASLQNQPAAPGEPSILLRLLFSLLTHIHPAWSACQTLRPPPPLHPLPPSITPPPPFPPLFLRSTGLVKVSQSPVALLYRLQCFLFKWRLFSCEYPCKEWLCCSSSSPCPVPFVWLFSAFTRALMSGCLYYLV